MTLNYISCQWIDSGYWNEAELEMICERQGKYWKYRAGIRLKMELVRNLELKRGQEYK